MLNLCQSSLTIREEYLKQVKKYLRDPMPQNSADATKHAVIRNVPKVSQIELAQQVSVL